MTEFDSNAAHLERVSSKIGAAVHWFCKVRIVGHISDDGTISTDGTFHMEELVQHVRVTTGVAPDSPGRILRNLRQRGFIDYEVLNRRASLYRVTRA